LRGTLKGNITQKAKGSSRIGAALGSEPSFPNLGRHSANLSTSQGPSDPSAAGGALLCFPIERFAPTSDLNCLPGSKRLPIAPLGTRVGLLRTSSERRANQQF
jgi:hypothetical protein